MLKEVCFCRDHKNEFTVVMEKIGRNKNKDFKLVKEPKNKNARLITKVLATDALLFCNQKEI